MPAGTPTYQDINLRYYPDWFEITGWEENPSGYGAVLARTPRTGQIELLQLAPSQEAHEEPASVGAPFLTWRAVYNRSDLDLDSQNVKRALVYAEVDEDDIREAQPHERALIIARALVLWGYNVGDETPAWSKDIPDAKWKKGTTQQLLKPAEVAYEKKLLNRPGGWREYWGPMDEGYSEPTGEEGYAIFFDGNVWLVTLALGYDDIDPEQLEAEAKPETFSTADEAAAFAEGINFDEWYERGNYDLTENPDGPLDPEEVFSAMKNDLSPTVEGLDVPFVRTHIYRLGRSPGLAISISLDPKAEWSNGIFENSRSSKFMIGYDHARGKWELEQLSRGPGAAKIRKYSTPDVSKLLSKIRSLPSLMDS